MFKLEFTQSQRYIDKMIIYEVSKFPVDYICESSF